MCKEKPHHFVGGTVRTKDWLRENFKADDQEFLRMDYEFISRIGRLIRHISERDLPKATVSVLFARYYNYDLDTPFLPQYQSNMQQLERTLTTLIMEEQ